MSRYREAGKVKITRFVDKHYLDAQVVEGVADADDLVRKHALPLGNLQHHSRRLYCYGVELSRR